MVKPIMIKLFILIVLLTILSLFVIAPIKQNAGVCSQYYDRPCNWYFPGETNCLCEGERLFLTEEMVIERQELLMLSATTSYTGYEYPNFTEIFGNVSKVNVSK